jgi:hypothetical protein
VGPSNGQASNDSVSTNLPLEVFFRRNTSTSADFRQAEVLGATGLQLARRVPDRQADCCIKLPVWQEAYGQLDGSLHYKAESPAGTCFLMPRT